MRNTITSLLCCGICLWFAESVSAQMISQVVYDSIEQKPITDVYVFINDSSIGTNTDDGGIYQLDLNGMTNISIIFSHLSYDTYQINLERQSNLRDTIYLSPSVLSLEEINVVEKGDKRLRAKRMKKFVNAFLGESKERRQVSILNPEVLLLFEEDDKLYATANQALMIENRRLGYTLQFYLKEFELTENDDVIYKGNISFKPLEATGKKLAKYKRNRRRTYAETHRSFFKDLVNHQVMPEDFYIGYTQMNYNREFVDFQSTSVDSFQIIAVDTNVYQIPIRNYFTVRYRKIKELQHKPPAQRMSPTFTTGLKQVKMRQDDSSTSYITSATDQILVDRLGRILNPLELEEYGFWASKRIASMLPFDYLPSQKE